MQHRDHLQYGAVQRIDRRGLDAEQAGSPWACNYGTGAGYGRLIQV